MTLTRFVLPSLVLGLVLSLAPSVATAGVVYGNLGSNGDTPAMAGVDSIALNSAARYAAAGFNTGAATFGALKLNSVTLALATSVSAGNVELWSSTGSGAGANPGSFLASAISVAPLTGNLFTFSFNADPQDGAALTANTDFWVVLKGPALWETHDPSSLPIVQNGATYTDITNYVRSSLNSGGTWATPGVQSVGFSVNAVPEPSTYAMAGIGAGLLGLAKFRRRLGRETTQG
jgi:hypothetical protein